ncbi:MAG: 6-bladed beta-propeller [Caulobacteraceae bacterium]
MADASKLGVAASDRNELMKRWKEVSSSCLKALELPIVAENTIDRSGTPTCVRSVICMSSNGQGISWDVNPSGLYNGTNNVHRVQWRSNPVNLGYTPTYPHTLIKGANGAVSVGVDSKDNLWAYQRAPVGVDALSKFDKSGKLLFTLGDSVIGHMNKAHGMAVDANDNAWIADETGSVILQISPDGKVLKTLGARGKRGDWDEAKGQRLLWEPVSIAFDPRNGDMYIGEGHGAESPNDRQSGEPHNASGAARVIRLDKNGAFISQISGNMMGAGHFWQAHDVAIDPTNGDLWIGDREEYRIVVYSNKGEFKKTIQMRNLVCNIAFDKNGDPWIGTGLDGQFLHLDRNGKILGAIGNGPGNGEGQIGETGYIRWDSKGNLIAGSTTQPRVTVWVKPGKKG